jgi:hypothetical protein
MGYYGGTGARLMRTLGPLQGTAEPTPAEGDRGVLETAGKSASPSTFPLTG